MPPGDRAHRPAGEGSRGARGACRGGDRRSGRDRGGVVPRAARHGNEGRGGRPRAGKGGGGDRRAVGAGGGARRRHRRVPGGLGGGARRPHLGAVRELPPPRQQRRRGCPLGQRLGDHPQRLALGPRGERDGRGPRHPRVRAADDRLRRTGTRDQHLIRRRWHRAAAGGVESTRRARPRCRPSPSASPSSCAPRAPRCGHRSSTRREACSRPGSGSPIAPARPSWPARSPGRPSR